MPPEESLTSQETGTGESLTPVAETGTGQDQAGGAPEAPPVEETVPKSRYVASTQEAQRLYQQQQQLLQQNAAMQQQLAQFQSYYQQQQTHQQAASTQQGSGGEIPASIYSEFSDAVLDRKPEGISKVLKTVKDQAKQEILQELGTQNAINQRMSGVTARIQNELKDLPEPLANTIWKRYTELSSDPIIVSRTVNDVIPVGNMMINPHIMYDAIREGKALMNAKSNDALNAARSETDYHTERSTPKGTNATPKFNPEKHLSPEERTIAAKTGMTPTRYWENLEKSAPGMQAARLKAGKPVSRRDLV